MINRIPYLLTLIMNCVLSAPVFFSSSVTAQGVDPMTGRAQVSLPLAGISYGGIDVPVVASHSGSAMKVRDGEGSAGVGWNLIAGGSVTRRVQGLPDDLLNKGWLYNSFALEIQNVFTPSGVPNTFPPDGSTCAQEDPAYQFLLGRGYNKDTEPDIYSVNAPGLSAEFIFDNDGKPRLLTYQDIAIEVCRADTISKFTVKTPAGLIYTFDIPEQVVRQSKQVTLPSGAAVIPSIMLAVYNYYFTPVRFTESWNLSKIETIHNSATATFTYSTGEKQSSARVIKAIMTDDQQYLISEERTPKNLVGISLGTSTLSFAWNDNLISNIIQTETSSQQNKEYGFYYYSTFYNNEEGTVVYRNFLQEIKQQSNCQPFPSFEFKYQDIDYANTAGVAVPFGIGGSEDLWGYLANTGYHVNFVLFPVPGVGHYKISTVVNPVVGGTQLPANGRYVGGSGAFGALIEISTPQGGVTAYTYESHRFFDPGLQQEVVGGGVRVKSVISYSGELAYGQSASDKKQIHAIEKAYEYELEYHQGWPTSGRLTYPPSFSIENLSLYDHYGEPSQVMYSRVVERIPGIPSLSIPGRGYTVYEYNLPGMYQSTTPDGDWVATKSYVARASSSCPSVSNWTNGTFRYPFAMNTNYDFERGRPTSVRVYKESDEGPDVLISEQLFTYERKPSTGLPIYGLKFDVNKVSGSNVYYFSKYKLLTGLGTVLKTLISKSSGDDSPVVYKTTTSEYTYNAGGVPVTGSLVNGCRWTSESEPLLMLEQKTSSEDGSYVRTVHEYAGQFNTITNPLGDAAAAIAELNATGRKGQLIETIRYIKPRTGAEYFAGASLSVFKMFNGKVRLYQTYSFPDTSVYSSTVATTVGSQQRLDWSPHYILNNQVEGYTPLGQPTDVVDGRNNRVSSHYSTSLAIGPVAVFAKVKGNQTAFEGFETTTGSGLNGPGNLITEAADVWTGTRAWQLGSGQTLINSSVEKNGNSYRVSCWVKASQAATITFQARNAGGVASLSPVALSYPVGAIGKWTYLEGVMNTTNASSTFTAEVFSNATVILDDVLIVPLTASVGLTTYNPLYGPTSSTDDRGNSVKQTYDLVGRPVYTFDRNRNLVSKLEYKMQKPAVQRLFATINTTATKFVVGTPVTFTAGDNCQTGLTFQWRVQGGSVLSTTSSLSNHVFALGGLHMVQLTVFNLQAGTSATFNKSVCVEWGAASASVSVVNTNGNTAIPGDVIAPCFGTNQKTFSILNFPGCSEGGSTAVSWIDLSTMQTLGSSPTLVCNLSYQTTTIRLVVMPGFCGYSWPGDCATGGYAPQMIIDTLITYDPTNQNCP